MKNDLENEVNERKIKSYNTTTVSNSRPIYSNITPERLTHWAMMVVVDRGVKLQYKLAQTRPVNIARMRDDPTSMIGRYNILHVCR